MRYIPLLTKLTSERVRAVVVLYEIEETTFDVIFFNLGSEEQTYDGLATINRDNLYSANMTNIFSSWYYVSFLRQLEIIYLLASSKTSFLTSG